jgi:RimJ/RimL family protein N-acetyltransferase
MDLIEPALPLDTERLRLRPFTPDDLDAVFAYQSRQDVARHLVWEARSLDEVKVALAAKVASRGLGAEGDGLTLAVVPKATGALVGEVVVQLASEEHRLGEIGYIIHPDHQGRGYAAEAGRAMLRLAFEGFGLHRVIGRVEPRNPASSRVLEKLGMRREAHFVENEFIKGEWQSELVYAILDREWRGQNGAGGSPGPRPGSDRAR